MTTDNILLEINTQNKKLVKLRTDNILMEFYSQNGCTILLAEITISDTGCATYEGLYQTWYGDGARRESSYALNGKDHGETIVFMDGKIHVDFYKHNTDDGTTISITDKVKSYFKDPLNPTKEEQLEVRLAFDIPLIPWNKPELRQVNSRGCFL